MLPGQCKLPCSSACVAPRAASSAETGSAAELGWIHFVYVEETYIALNKHSRPAAPRSGPSFWAQIMQRSESCHGVPLGCRHTLKLSKLEVNMF
jgi:hypothetical protein